jgi:hypothetical protein
VVLAIVMVLPTHTAAGPVIASGKGVTVITLDAEQPVPESVYTILAVPAATPVRRPVEGAIVATVGAPEVQTPPAVADESVVFAPAQTVYVPLTGIM